MNTLLLVASAALLSACAASATARVHPDWERRLPAVKTVVVVPPQVSVSRPDEDELEECEPGELRELQGELMSLAADTLRAGGFAVSLVRADDPRMERVQADYGRALEDLYRERNDFEFPEGEEETYRVSMGPAVHDAALGSEEEVVLCFRVSGMKRSLGGWLGDSFADALTFTAQEAAGAALAEAVFGLPTAPQTSTPSGVPSSSCSVSASIVDPRTGELLWTDTVGAEGYSESKAKSQVEGLIRRLSASR